MIKGFTASAFDLLHAGHVAMLEEARNQCDYLIVGLHTDPTIDRPEKNRPVQTSFERFMQLKACKFVDEIIPYDTEEDLVNLLQVMQPDFRFIGEEYRGKRFTGNELPIKMIYTTRRHNFSSSGLRQRIQNAQSINSNPNP
jgi:glycerol-3-phosphate cytidylyltransferase